jgi:hypothetical protein
LLPVDPTQSGSVKVYRSRKVSRGQSSAPKRKRYELSIAIVFAAETPEHLSTGPTILPVNSFSRNDPFFVCGRSVVAVAIT